MEEVTLNEQMPEYTPEVQCGNYVPSYNEAIRNYEINIAFLSRGMVISVGCQKIPFESNEKGVEELANYVKDPVGTQKKWLEIFK